METNEQSSSGKIIAALIIGLILGFASGAFWQGRQTSAKSEMANTESSTTTTTSKLDETEPIAMGTSTARVLVKNQMAGDKVVVEEAAVDAPAWVAVQENKDGKPGNILGAQKVFPGVSRDIIVELLRPTVSGAKYRAVLYRDAGSPAFNFREDILVPDVEASFETKA